MKINIASHAGFCFGVKRATETVERELASADGAAIYTLGKIIHNDGYNAYLRSRGVIEMTEADIGRVCDEAKKGRAVTVIIRAHGEVRERLDRLRECAASSPSMKLLDCTCPYVNKVRRIAAENSGEGKVFILIGAKDHPEVQGIMSCADGEKYVFSGADELESWLRDGGIVKLHKKTVAIAAQTTQKLSEWKKCLNISERVCTNALIFDTICSVTEERQTEAESLAKGSDLMLVIGSRNSSNTVKLYEICKASCPETYLVENAAELRIPAHPRAGILSITAGASTPFSIIQEVEKTMNEQTQTFEEMLESSMKTLNPGDIVVGVITSISQNEIHLDLGAKTTGVIVHDKLTDDPAAKLDELFKVGDEVKAKVIKVSDIDGIAMLDKTRVDSSKYWDIIVEAEKSGETLEGKIVEAVKGGIIISLNSVRVFIPASLTGLPKGSDDDALHALVGTTQKVKIIEIKEERHRALASIRAVQRAERLVKEEAFWNQVEIGQIYEGPIKSMTNFGVFIDLGGVDGLVHISELSWKRLRHPSEVVKTGDVLRVFVKDLDREKKRISLGYKTEESDPWYIFTNKYSVGDTAKVKIVSLMPFGAFAEVVPGADGLIHISQIADHKIEKPADVLKVGDEVDAKIVGIDEEKRKISLSIRALIEDAKEAEESVPAADDAAETPVMYSTDNPEAYEGFGKDAE